MGRRANLCRTVCRLREGHAFRPPLAGIFGQQNGCLGKQPDNHNQSGLHVDVVLQPEQSREQEAAHQTARHGQQHGKRDEHAFIEGTQYEVYQDHAQHEYPHGIVRRIAFLRATTLPLVGVT